MHILIALPKDVYNLMCIAGLMLDNHCYTRRPGKQIKSLVSTSNNKSMVVKFQFMLDDLRIIKMYQFPKKKKKNKHQEKWSGTHQSISQIWMCVYFYVCVCAYLSTYPRRTPLSWGSGGGCHWTMMDWFVRPLATMFFGGALGASSLSINLTYTHTRRKEREQERQMISI